VSFLVTRPEGERDQLVERLRALGHRVHAVPTVATEPLPFPAPDLGRFDWVVVTSATGARCLLERVFPPSRHDEPPPPRGGRRRPSWAAVGPRTAAELAVRGITATAIPDERVGAAIAGAMGERGPLCGLRVLLARADAAGEDLPASLRAGGAVVEELEVYRTIVGPEAMRPALLAALEDPELAAVVFASGSAVRGLVRLGGPEVRRLPAICIGPVTSAVARAEGFGIAGEAAAPGVEELAEAVLAAISD
jgi:uroporphyrinogen-III synthase